jgi:GNAT superfamily N-acetyltransferase
MNEGCEGPVVATDAVINRLDQLTLDRFAELLAESEAAGYAFLRRVADEWASGVNPFSKPGEALFAAEIDGRIVGVCGLNVDPYLNEERVGRVRNVYVLARYRRLGIGRRLVTTAIGAARGTFDRLRLRAEAPAPARLYETLGFRRWTDSPSCTHVMDLTD